MDNWNYAFIASIVTVIGMSVVSILTSFKLWKVTLTIFCISSIGFCIIAGLGRRSENHGFDGEWGAHGVLMEFLNLEMISISFAVGAFMTLIIFLCIILSGNNK
jgi:uncharacterized membrane protein YhaH (DUF805 family)